MCAWFDVALRFCFLAGETVSSRFGAPLRFVFGARLDSGSRARRSPALQRRRCRDLLPAGRFPRQGEKKSARVLHLNALPSRELRVCASGCFDAHADAMGPRPSAFGSVGVERRQCANLMRPNARHRMTTRRQRSSYARSAWLQSFTARLMHDLQFISANCKDSCLLLPYIWSAIVSRAGTRCILLWRELACVRHRQIASTLLLFLV